MVEAERFLTQATFGATDTTVQQVQTQGFNAWLNAQIAMPAADHDARDLHRRRHRREWRGG